MELINFITLPLTCNEDEVKGFVDSVLDNYIKELNKVHNPILAPDKSIIPKIEFLIKGIKKTFLAYYSGSVIDAFFILKECLDAIEDELLFEISPLHPNHNESFYRMRISESNSLSKENMFHVPFQHRGKVSQSRYSIPGVPCLYLSASIYTCWLELNKPDLKKCHISRFNFTESYLSFLDFSWHPKRFFTIINSNIKSSSNIEDLYYFQKKLQNYYIIWPLIFATTINLEGHTNQFNPHYIIPNLLIEWIRKTNQIDGIKYFSSRISSNPNDFISSFVNIAMPVKSVKNEGYCDILAKKVKLCKPISPNENHPKVYTDPLMRAKEAFRWLIDYGCAIGNIEYNGNILPYVDTVFGGLEVDLSFNKPEELFIST